MPNQCKHGIHAFSYCNQCCLEIVAVRYLDKKADFIRAAYAMVLQHNIHKTMLSAVESVSKDFPDIPEPLLTALWIGINAKHRDLELEAWMAVCRDNHDFGCMD